MLTFDAIIIGAGQSGVPLAMKLSKEGMETALIEKREVGGTCVNDGCTPTKTLIASAENAYRIKNSERWGIQVPSFQIDFEKVIQRKNELVEQSINGIKKGIEKADNLTLFKDEACFVAPKELKIKSENLTITAEKIFIDAGLKPNIPPIKGLEDISFLTSTSLLNLEKLPEHLIVIGGSYIGLEMAQLFSRLGSSVSIIEKSKRLLPKEDADVAQEIENILTKEDIHIYTNAEIQFVKGPSPEVSILIDGMEKQIKGSHLLMATGRKPQTEALNLGKAGINTDEKGFIEVDEYLETNVEDVFALGDIKGGPAFTHISYNDYIVVYENLINKAKRKFDDRQKPYCMFTDPQLGRIGLTESDANARKIEIDVFKLPMKNSGRGKETAQTAGFMKAIADKESGKILGVSILSAEGGEVMSVLQMAMEAGLTAKQLKEQVFAHPLFSEAINNLFMS